MATDNFISTELKSLHDKKSALERAVKIAASIERLHHSLQAVMLMGKPTSSISKKALANLEELDEKTSLLSGEKLKDILGKLEHKIKKDLVEIIHIADLDDASIHDGDQEEGLIAVDCEAVLNDYMKNAQTAVALKVLLRSRGEVTRPLQIALPVDELKVRLSSLDKRESECRTKVKTDISELIGSMDVMLARDDVSDEVLEMMQVVKSDLQINLDHINSGKNINELPVAMESVEMGESLSKEKKRAIKKPQKQKKPETEEAPVAKPVENKVKSKKPGFFYILLKWVTTPPSIGWNDIKNEDKDK